MTINTNTTCQVICTCDHFPPLREQIIKPNTVRDLAVDLTRETTCAARVYEAMLDDLFAFHSGVLRGFDREPLDLWAFDKNGDDIIDRAFGVGYRNLRRLLDRACVPRIQRLNKEHHAMALLLFHSRSIRNCRTVGFCAQRMQSAQSPT